MSNPLPKHLLPASLLQIAEYCGEDTMWTVWGAFGGGRFFVPEHVTPEHRLSDLLGYAVACKFCETFGGELLTIPKADAAKRAVRNQMIRQAKAEGLDNFTLARRYNLTDRQIMEICKAEEPVSVNCDLFD